jgi:hypothetical protein
MFSFQVPLKLGLVAAETNMAEARMKSGKRSLLGLFMPANTRGRVYLFRTYPIGEIYPYLAAFDGVNRSISAMGINRHSDPHVDVL